MTNHPWPVEVRLIQAENILRIEFEDASSFQFTAEFLRVHSPSAEVKGHGPGQEVVVAGKRNVSIMRLDPVGNYALRIHFSDGHDTGLFSWAYFHEIGVKQAVLWAEYLQKLSAKGLSRDPAVTKGLQFNA